MQLLAITDIYLKPYMFQMAEEFIRLVSTSVFDREDV